MKLTDLEKALLTKVEEMDEKVEQADSYFKWWQESEDNLKKAEAEIAELKAQLAYLKDSEGEADSNV